MRPSASRFGITTCDGDTPLGSQARKAAGDELPDEDVAAETKVGFSELDRAE